MQEVWADGRERGSDGRWYNYTMTMHDVSRCHIHLLRPIHSMRPIHVRARVQPPSSYSSVCAGERPRQQHCRTSNIHHLPDPVGIPAPPAVVAEGSASFTAVFISRASCRAAARIRWSSLKRDERSCWPKGVKCFDGRDSCTISPARDTVYMRTPVGAAVGLYLPTRVLPNKTCTYQ